MLGVLAGCDTSVLGKEWIAIQEFPTGLMLAPDLAQKSVTRPTDMTVRIPMSGSSASWFPWALVSLSLGVFIILVLVVGG